MPPSTMRATSISVPLSMVLCMIREGKQQGGTVGEQQQQFQSVHRLRQRHHRRQGQQPLDRLLQERSLSASTSASRPSTAGVSRHRTTSSAAAFHLLHQARMEKHGVRYKTVAYSVLMLQERLSPTLSHLPVPASSTKTERGDYWISNGSALYSYNPSYRSIPAETHLYQCRHLLYDR